MSGSDWPGPCKDDPESWDLDSGDLTRWLRAIRTCQESCPVLQECRALRTAAYPDSAAGRPPASSYTMPTAVIWAGVAYSERGRELDKAGIRLVWARSKKRADRVA